MNKRTQLYASKEIFQFSLPSEMNSENVHLISKKSKKTIPQALMHSKILQLANR